MQFYDAGQFALAVDDFFAAYQSMPNARRDRAGREQLLGEPMTECGNGVLEVFGPEPEECDDNNLDPNDGCSETCALDRRGFVTGVLYNGASRNFDSVLL